MNFRYHHIAQVTVVLLLFASCSANKYLQTGERYYEGSSIVLESESKIDKTDRNETKDDIEEVFSKDPNLKILGSRPRVWFYHLAGEVEKEKGFKYWMKYKLGEAPVLLDQIDIPATRRLIQNRLETNGFFQYRVLSEIDSGKHKASIKYIAEVGEPYRYDSIYKYTPDSLAVVKALNSNLEESELGKGGRYRFKKLTDERARQEKFLRESGYYFFDDRYIIYDADTTIGDRKVNLYPQLKEDIPDKAKDIYRIKEVNVFADYRWAASDSVKRKIPDTLRLENVNYIYRNENFRPEILISHVGFRPGDIYSRERELTTLNRMIQLDAFRYVNVSFKEEADQELSANVYLSPLKKKSLRLMVEAVSTSNSFVGPHLTVSFMNRNFLKGAERYELNITTGYEWQIGGGSDESLNNYEVGVENILSVPRLILPFNIRYDNARFIPETKFKLGAKFQRRVGYYQLNSINGSYGFEWKETITKRHLFYPADIKFIDLSNTTPEFDSLLLENPFLARSFEEQFIIGSKYSYYFSSQESEGNRNRTHNFYFNGNVDLSGNLLRATQKLAGSQATDEGSYRIFGRTYSQFVRASIDFRHYWNIDRNNRLATRLVTGVGYAFGNSVTLPYTMQFSVGGSSSLRGFRARSVGPGSFKPDSTITFIDQTGDIKLELNVEYRFQILGALKGAVFVDAGNIWTFRSDPQRPGAEFRWGNVLNELAINSGFGIRYDFQFFIIRLDMGIPLRVPYTYVDSDGNPANFPVRPWERDWRKQYRIWNIAIGYPF